MMEKTLSGERECTSDEDDGECEMTSSQNEVRRNERNCERDAAERVAAKGSSIRIPRHAPSYHIDLAIVTILSSLAMLGCTSRGWKRDARKRGVVQEGSGKRIRGMARVDRTAWCTTPPHDGANVSRRGLNASESVVG